MLIKVTIFLSVWLAAVVEGDRHKFCVNCDALSGTEKCLETDGGACAELSASERVKISKLNDCFEVAYYQEGVVSGDDQWKSCVYAEGSEKLTTNCLPEKTCTAISAEDITLCVGTDADSSYCRFFGQTAKIEKIDTVHGLQGWQIALIVVGAVVLLVAVGLTIYCCVRWKHRKEQKQKKKETARQAKIDRAMAKVKAEQEGVWAQGEFDDREDAQPAPVYIHIQHRPSQHPQPHPGASMPYPPPAEPAPVYEPDPYVKPSKFGRKTQAQLYEDYPEQGPGSSVPSASTVGGTGTGPGPSNQPMPKGGNGRGGRPGGAAARARNDPAFQSMTQEDFDAEFGGADFYSQKYGDGGNWPS
uniref:T cell CD4 receptor C-terminal region domain-containing protein n=1 Tax=Chromera velia CCMP2878 TaxID=1169474 RepID=A0A0G4HUN3_9ALVE|eukprot:Cvel_8678.t1-p1 / transcript=Cvel_8678.t1 / gene=Cvel_8678 / organism=Chromera_velia_CCMP2878 / gene_product=hypothetical protein / transcript_product=hypothetical protein / location=Cvel_scaffold484:35160-36533(+) / protein_length=357 / sequence_SO=supercontig / SO=protein_coding / is_pseudo=false